MAAAINKQSSDSRFVSVFADSTPDVDITFMVPFLQRPTDHYVCGVDDLTISLSALGILDDTERGRRHHTQSDPATAQRERGRSFTERGARPI